MNSRVLSATTVFIALCLLQAAARWAGPVAFADRYNSYGALINAVHHDLATSRVHLVYTDLRWSAYIHKLFSLDGTAVWESVIIPSGDASNAVLRPLGGERLSLAFRSRTFNSARRDTVYLAETRNSGKEWTMNNVMEQDQKDRKMEDMIYVNETGRTFVLFTNEKGEMWFVSRAAGAKTFSSERLIVPGVTTAMYLYAARATYTMLRGNVPRLHVLFREAVGGRMMYTRSDNNGVTWTVPRKVSGMDAVEYITNVFAAENTFYAVYTVYKGPARAIFSKDQGETFASPLAVTTKNAAFQNVTAGFAPCQGRPGTMASLFALEDGSLEYSTWDSELKTRKARTYAALPNGKATAVGIDCVVQAGEMSLTSFVTLRAEEHNYVYFAREYFQDQVTS